MTNGEKMQAVFPDIEMWGESKDTLEYSLGGMIHRVTKSWWNTEYKEPTTKNVLAHNLCDSCTNIGCEFQSGNVRTECAFYMPPHIEPDNCGNYADHLVPRKVVERIIMSPRTQEQMLSMLNSIQSVIPQEPRWIPVSERLPDELKDVFAYLSSGRISICRYNNHKLPFWDNPIGWGYLYGNGFIDFTKEQVIAWMPTDALSKPFESQEMKEKI